MKHSITNATATTLRPKNMAQLYEDQIVTLCRKGGRYDPVTHYRRGGVFHLLWGISDWAEAEARFGETVAVFDPARKCWLEPRTFHADERMSLKELYALIGDAEVCMLGRDCPKHTE